MGIKIIARNKKASYNYEFIKKFEAGLALQGTEVKSLLGGQVSISESHITLDARQEAWAHNIHIPHYAFGNIQNHQERRKRKLLLHKKELQEIFHRTRAEKLTIVPTALYFKNSKAKLELALARGKRKYDKRQAEMKKDFRSLQADLRRR